MDKIEELNRIINSSQNIVFFGGAGVSTESGIPDFRSANGIYMMNYKYSPEQIVSHSFFVNHTLEFYDFYKKHLIYPDAKPNITHLTLAKLEQSGLISAIVTQNIDGLHTLAGSKNVYEIHGSVHRNYCTKCNRFFDLNYILSHEGIPYCDCGGMIKPDVVLYEEMLNNDLIEKSIKSISNCDTLIVAGTSLNVYPAAGFLEYFNGKNLILINKDSTPKDKEFGLVINDSLGNVMKKIVI